MAQREKPKIVEYVLQKDQIITNAFVRWLSKYTTCRSLKVHCKALEISCDGIVWLSSWLAFIWLASSVTFYQMQLNFLIGLLLDVIAIAILKAIFRRRRPSVIDKGTLTIGPDKFSFPSGHASRSCFIAYFFIVCYPITAIFWLPLIAWCVSICISRLIMQRHYIFDVIAGVFLGIMEAFVIQLIWISENNAINIINYLSNDNLPGGAE